MIQQARVCIVIWMQFFKKVLFLTHAKRACYAISRIVCFFHKKNMRSIWYQAAMFYTRITRIRCLAFTLWLSPTLALASSTDNMLTSVLSGLIGILTSTPARLMFVVAIIGVGYGTLALGKIPKERAVAIVIGIGIVFSASFIAQKMGLGT